MNKFFIPEVIEVNGIKIPSTPFNSHNGTPIFLGDVFEVKFTDEESVSTEIYLAELITGSYFGTCKDEQKATLLWMHDTDSIKVLGSSVSNPELLELLSE